MKTAVVIPAAGRGRRAGAGAPKVYRRLAGEMVLSRTIRSLLAVQHIDQVICCIHPDDRPLYEEAVATIDDPRLSPPVHGGDTRRASVLRGLEALADTPPDHVLIHDGARPFCPPNVIRRAIEALAEHQGACVAIRATDTMRHEVAGLCAEQAPRDGVWRAQTPQAFRFPPLLAAYRSGLGEDGDDDTEIARLAGMAVTLVEGHPRNTKLTTPADFEEAEARLRTTAMDIRTGNGFDVHRFKAGDSVTLCGVTIPHDKALEGHSDADVGLHALTDALFGAIGLGDIGTWFPPSDPQWNGASSDHFMSFAVAKLAEREGVITNLDVTLICERPKIGPHANDMRARIAEIAAIGIDRVSVKATTTEGLGFPGRGEGIAALATATVRIGG